jgi:hypothetical protein
MRRPKLDNVWALGIPGVMEQKTSILCKRLYLLLSPWHPWDCFCGHNAHSTGGRKRLSQARFNAKRRENQVLMSTIDVESNPRFLP